MPSTLQQNQRHYFERRNKPVSWLRNAQTLKHAGELLFDAYREDLANLPSDEPPEGLENLEMNSPANLLFGLSLESLIKALRIRRRLDKQEPGQSIFQGAKGHKLSDLLKGTTVQLTRKEQDLLQRLEAFVLWAGRYPVPTRENSVFLQQLGSMSPEIPPLPIRPGEKQIFDGLFEKLETAFGPIYVKEGGKIRFLPD